MVDGFLLMINWHDLDLCFNSDLFSELIKTLL
jgi:hypothetical protein